MKLAGKVSVPLARLMVTTLSSSGHHPQGAFLRHALITLTAILLLCKS